MKKFLTMTLMVLGIISVYSQNRSINFLEGKTFAEVKEIAKKENKLIFVDFYTTWCGPCKRMDKEVYINDSVADFYNSHFINIKIDAEKGEGVELRKKYEVQAYPTFLFVSIDGEMLHRGSGFKKTGDFIQLGSNALNPEKQVVKYFDTYKKGNRDAKSILELVDSMRAVQMPVGKIISEYLSSQNDSDLFSQTNWQLINLYVSDIESREFQFLANNYKEFSVLYGDSAIERKIEKIFIYKVFAIGRSRDKDKLGQFLNLKDLIKKYHFTQESNILFAIELNYYYGARDWGELSKVCTSGFIEKYYWNRATSLNMLATAFYENIKDGDMLKRSLKWAARSVELEDSAENNAIYARLLLKLGQREKAIEMESRAISLAIRDGLIDAKDFDKLLTEFKKKKR